VAGWRFGLHAPQLQTRHPKRTAHLAFVKALKRCHEFKERLPPRGKIVISACVYLRKNSPIFFYIPDMYAIESVSLKNEVYSPGFYGFRRYCGRKQGEMILLRVFSQ
jgi:hypothetical protein